MNLPVLGRGRTKVIAAVAVVVLLPLGYFALSSMGIGNAVVAGQPAELRKEASTDHSPAVTEKPDEAAAAHAQQSKGINKHAGHVPLPEIFLQPSSATHAFVRHVRALVRQQAAMAHGVAGAAEQQKILLARLGSEGRQIDPAKVTEFEIRAAAVFVLSGGDPQIAQRLVNGQLIRPRDNSLLKAVISYVRGQEDAGKLLQDIKPEEFDDSVAARLYLARAQLNLKSVDKMVEQDLLKAATLATGTLVEEAALRRLVEHAAFRGHARLFVKHALTYLRRFSASLYRSEFLQVFLAGVLTLESKAQPVARESLRRIFQDLRGDDRQDVVMQLSSGALTLRLLALCKFVAEQGLAQGFRDAVVKQRMTLHLAACDVIDNPRGSLVLLDQVERRMLSEDEVRILQSVRTLAEAMTAVVKTDPMIDPGALAEDAEFDGIKASVAQHLQTMKAALSKVSP